jgi:hypothetical protein
MDLTLIDCPPLTAMVLTTGLATAYQKEENYSDDVDDRL